MTTLGGVNAWKKIKKMMLSCWVTEEEEVWKY